VSTIAGRRVIILGDSHVDGSTFGKSLEKMLAANGASVTRMGWGGSAARTWIAGRPIFGKQYTLEQVRTSGPYDVAIVSLGTNDGANAGVNTQDAGALSREADKSIAQIKQVMDATGASVVWWVEPPVMGDRVKHYTNYNIDFVRKAGRREFGSRSIDSTVVGAPDGDGVHLGGRGGQAWAQVVHDKVVSETSLIPEGSGALWWGLGLSFAAVLGAVIWKVKRGG
jgi:hypothetical protein